MSRLFQQIITQKVGSIPEWVQKAITDFPELADHVGTLLSAYSIDANIEHSFDGVGRWIQSDNTASFSRVIPFNADTDSIDCLFRKPNQTSSIITILFGQTWNSISLTAYGWSSDVTRIVCDTNSTIFIVLSPNVNYHYHGDKNYQDINGTRANNPCTSKGVFAPFPNGVGVTPSNLFMGYLRVKNDEGSVAFWIPFVKDGENGMLDITTNTFYTSVSGGNFNIV